MFGDTIPVAQKIPRAPFDVPGAVLGAATVVLAIYAIIEASHRSWVAVRIASASMILLGVLFFVVESQRRHPLLPLRILTRPRAEGAERPML
jgi:hypothetical protein